MLSLVMEESVTNSNSSRTVITATLRFWKKSEGIEKKKKEKIFVDIDINIQNIFASHVNLFESAHAYH